MPKSLKEMFGAAPLVHMVSAGQSSKIKNQNGDSADEAKFISKQISSAAPLDQTGDVGKNLAAAVSAVHQNSLKGKNPQSPDGVYEGVATNGHFQQMNNDPRKIRDRKTATTPDVVPSDEDRQKILDSLPHKKKNEDEITEISKQTLGQYVKLAHAQSHIDAGRGNNLIATAQKEKDDPAFKRKAFDMGVELLGKASKRQVGINKAVNKMVKEDEDDILDAIYEGEILGRDLIEDNINEGRAPVNISSTKWDHLDNASRHYDQSNHFAKHAEWYGATGHKAASSKMEEIAKLHAQIGQLHSAIYTDFDEKDGGKK